MLAVIVMFQLFSGRVSGTFPTVVLCRVAVTEPLTVPSVSDSVIPPVMASVDSPLPSWPKLSEVDVLNVSPSLHCLYLSYSKTCSLSCVASVRSLTRSAMTSCVVRGFSVSAAILLPVPVVGVI